VLRESAVRRVGTDARPPVFMHKKVIEEQESVSMRTFEPTPRGRIARVKSASGSVPGQDLRRSRNGDLSVCTVKVTCIVEAGEC
jgi:hypothetical protein